MRIRCECVCVCVPFKCVWYSASFNRSLFFVQLDMKMFVSWLVCSMDDDRFTLVVLIQSHLLICVLYFKCFGSYHIGSKMDQLSSSMYLDTLRRIVRVFFLSHNGSGYYRHPFAHRNVSPWFYTHRWNYNKNTKNFAVRFLFGFVILFDDCNFSLASLLTYSLSHSFSLARTISLITLLCAITVAVIVLCVCFHSSDEPRTKIGM